MKFLKIKNFNTTGVSSLIVSYPPSDHYGHVFTLVENFYIESTRLVRKCTKPNKREYKAILYACSFGFLTMGLIGFFIKLLFIPVSNILVGMG